MVSIFFSDSSSAVQKVNCEHIKKKGRVPFSVSEEQLARFLHGPLNRPF